MKRTVAALLLILSLLPLLFGCGDGGPTDEELYGIAGRLLDDALFVNEVFLGDGIPAEEWAFDGYRYADEAWMQEHGVYTVEALLESASAVYTEEVVLMLTRFAALGSTEELPHYRDRMVEDGLLVLDGRTGMYRELLFEYRKDTMTVEEKSAERALVSLSVLVRREGEAAQEKTLRLPLVRGEDGWRLDKLSYVAFDDAD